MVDGDTLIDCGEMGVHRSNSEKSYRVPHRYTQRANREEKRRDEWIRAMMRKERTRSSVQPS